VRVISEDGEQLGIMAPRDAMREAENRGYDLVEVAPQATPPVCRIMDYGKFKYEQKKKQQKNQKQHQVQVKEIRLRPKIGDHDVEFKTKRAREFLEGRDKVKLNVMFRGRENAHHERGREILQQVITALEDIAKVEKTPGMEGGRSMTAVLTPK